jgi:hypothetical protein
MNIKLFSNYSTSEVLTDELLKKYSYNNDGLLHFTCSGDYDLSVVFNATNDKDLNFSKPIITIIQEPSVYWQNLDKSFLMYSDLVILHDRTLFPYAENVLERLIYLSYRDKRPVDFFVNKLPYFKSKKISIIVSNKSFFEGHRQRLDFLYKILNSDLDIDIYDRGLMIDDTRYKGELENKFDGLSSYEYSICIENAIEKNYVTEKFFDCLICDTVPIYYGAPNCRDIFDDRGYFTIDIHNPNVIEEIKNYCKQPHSNYQKYIWRIK